MPSEADTIAAAQRPATVSSLVDDLDRLGLGRGDTAIVHTSLSALGWVIGGAQAVVEALLAAVGPHGTIVMPTQSGHLSDPASWMDPPVPAEWFDAIRTEMPAFDPDVTPTRSMGAVVECFRGHRSSRRSAHPTESFAALGPNAAHIIADHRFDDGFGESSPLASLYELDAKILLLGVGHGNDTSLHLAEHRAEWTPKATERISAPMLVDGTRAWVTAERLEPNEDDFDQIGSAMADTDIETVGSVGAGTARLMSMRAAVDFGVAWMSEHRPASLAN
ncbi:MAG: aminoglycoside N(3)-acetyltransferase [Ilumatobacter sp.]